MYKCHFLTCLVPQTLHPSLVWEVVGKTRGPSLGVWENLPRVPQLAGGGTRAPGQPHTFSHPCPSRLFGQSSQPEGGTQSCSFPHATRKTRLDFRCLRGM